MPDPNKESFRPLNIFEGSFHYNDKGISSFPCDDNIYNQTDYEMTLKDIEKRLECVENELKNKPSSIIISPTPEEVSRYGNIKNKSKLIT